MKTHLHRFGYTTACGIKVDPKFHVGVNEVTCENCRKTRAWHNVYIRSLKEITIK